MISAETFNTYTNATNALANSASNTVEREVAKLVGEVGAENISAIREGSKTIMSTVAKEYSAAAASLAAQFYDTQAQNSTLKLTSAITESVYSDELVKKVAHYQAKKLIKRDSVGFAKACGELAANNVKQSLNATIVANCKRDEDEGVMYARVLSGWENCKFCIMLAGRGAVYHSRKTAGELNHYHRRCDCKIVPDFEGGEPMRTLVEGHDPWVEYRTYKRLENAQVLASKLYTQTSQEIINQAEGLNEGLKAKWSGQKAEGDYQGIYGKYLAEYGVSAEDYTHILGKELQVGQWLAAQGFEVQFLHTNGNDKTPDILLNGEKWEIKRIETSKIGKTRTRVSSALKQSCNIIVDLSVNYNSEDLIIPVIKLLEDVRAEKIMIIDKGTSTLYKKTVR